MPGVLVSEGLWPNHAFVDGEGINVLTGADCIARSAAPRFTTTMSGCASERISVVVGVA